MRAEASTELRDDEGATPLHIAARCDHPERVRLLLKAGASSAALDAQGRTPLMRARAARSAGCAHLLAAHAAAVAEVGKPNPKPKPNPNH